MPPRLTAFLVATLDFIRLPAGGFRFFRAIDDLPELPDVAAYLQHRVNGAPPKDNPTDGPRLFPLDRSRPQLLSIRRRDNTGRAKVPASLQGELQPTIYRFKLGEFEVATVLDAKAIREGLLGYSLVVARLRAAEPACF